MGQRVKQIFIFVLVGLCLASLTLLMTLSYYHLKTQSEAALKESKTYNDHITMITNDITSPYWQQVYAGAREEAGISDTYVELMGSNFVENYTVTEKTKLAEYEGTDGILVYPEQTDEMIQLINDAKGISIPIVTMQKDSSDSKRIAFVGNNDYFYGQALGKRIQQMKRDGNHCNVSILVPSNTYTAANKDWLRNGVISTVGEKDYTISMSDIHETNGLIDAEDALNNIIGNASEEPDILVCMDLRTTEIAYKILKDRTLDKTIRIIGNDISKIVVQGIMERSIDSVIMIDPTELGKKSVDAYLKYKKFGLVDNYTEVQTQLIDADNAEEVLEEREEVTRNEDVS